MKLELKHLAPYLPYSLNVSSWKCERTIKSLHQSSIMTEKFHNVLDFKHIKPILRPLSDLAKKIEINKVAFIPLEHIARDYTADIDFIEDNKVFWQSMSGNGLSTFSYEIEIINIFDEEPVLIEHLLIDEKGDGTPLSYFHYQQLIEWHFDVFNLIPQGLAIDINTLNK